MNAQMLGHSRLSQTTTWMKNMTTIMQRTISIMVKQMTWMVLETAGEEMMAVAEVRISRHPLSVLTFPNNGIRNRL